MLKSPVLNANATDKPVNIIGIAYTKYSPNILGVKKPLDEPILSIFIPVTALIIDLNNTDGS